MPFDLDQLYSDRFAAQSAVSPGNAASPPRTAILLPSGCLFSASSPNSMETVVRALAGAVDHMNIRIFCCEGATDHGVPGVEVLPAGPQHRRILLEKLRAFGPQVVEHHQQAKRALAIAAGFPQAAHLLYRHNAVKAPRNRFDAWRYNKRYARMDGFVFVSVAEQALFASRYPRLADRAWAVPNPIDAEPWLASPEHREPVILFAGRAMPEKGVDMICAALPALLDRYPDWRAVLMLNDWEQHQHWAARHVQPLERLGQRVVVLRSASLSEVRRQMKSAAIALTPSAWDEPFGLAAVEAHAAGAALISSGRGGLREASGPHALYLDDVTPQTISAAIEHLILNSSDRLEMARAAQRYVVEVHSPRVRAEQLERIRRQAAARLIFETGRARKL